MAVYQVKVKASYLGQDVLNVFYFEGDITNPQQFVDDLGALYTNLAQQLVEEITFEQIAIKQLLPTETPEQNFIPSGWPVQGNLLGDPTPSFIAALVSFYGQNNTYPYRSRKYIAGIDEAAVSGNEIVGSVLLSALDAWGGGIVNFSSTGATGNFVAFRPSDGATNPLGVHIVRTQLATMRSRKR